MRNFSFLKKIKPGISDFSSILLRNEDKILASIGGINPYNKLLPIKLTLADYYSRHKSFILDLKLVFITIVSIFFPKISNNILYNIIKKDELEEVIKFIRMHINFQGLLISDDLSMEALSGSLSQRATEALSAGCDIGLHCSGRLDEMVEIACANLQFNESSEIRIDTFLSQIKSTIQSFAF